ncbi:TetR/AcrR family transcriptional regulator [Agromyces mangrovi Wang et al. 2018]|uniref:TetR/AcrR family transcriptional regulator n=1 Tax=Agromyces mangrovi TaxID=1858653 RepID=UPI00257264BC|nr:TetR/AcrR family transcriptional regulator [Agromyces mangrovi]BDZ64375.1 TetR family transcriptional regulator [Agromyces mangrovi]
MNIAGRPMRADAVRNRAKIVDAAYEQIAAHGVDVGMDEIAQAAGVAVGTLYRHFPTKTDLVAAIVEHYVDAAATDAEASYTRVLSGSSRAVDELIEYFRVVGDSSAEHVAVKSTARSLGLDPHPGTSGAARVEAALAGLVAQGQADGDIRPEITVDDLILLLTTAPVDQSAELRERWLQLILPGLTTR